MNEQLKYLIELQQIDRKIIDLDSLIGDIPSRIRAAELLLNTSQKAFLAGKEKLESLEKRKRDRERELDEIGEKVRKLKARTSEIKTNKEYQALLTEIESVEKDQFSIEDEILLVMEEMENASKEAKTEEAKYGQEQEKIDVLKQKLEAEKSSYEQELSKLKTLRAGMAQTIDNELYEEYITLIGIHRGFAVTEARDEICQGCNMNIPPQLFVELKKNEIIIQCPQCRRILYYKNNS
ncbi:MAG: zinc ribbon domain-containing protein [Nitrospirota bacterium]